MPKFAVDFEIFSEKEKFCVAFLGTFLPRKCGIATFTYDLANSFRYCDGPLNKPDYFVIAVNDFNNKYTYDDNVVKFEIQEENLNSYLQAADFINTSKASIVNIQHEFEIFGGVHCENLLRFLHRVKKPVITTLHTVFLDPEPSYKNMTKKIADRSSKIVVLSNRAIELLVTRYQISAGRICMIPHGVPDVKKYSSQEYKRKLNIEKSTVIVTFGLIGSNKGIEYALYALVDIIKTHPNILYLIVGETHPRVRLESDEMYRTSLKKLVQELGLQNNILFIDRFLVLRELLDYVRCADIVLAPYLSLNQIASGTLAYAIGCGKAIVSTSSLYAQGVLSDGRGIIVNFKNSKDIKDALLRIIKNRKVKKKLEQAAYNYGRHMIWPSVARAYKDLFYSTYQGITANVHVS